MLADEAAKPGPVPLQCLRDELILLGNCPVARNLTHLQV
jgi:hypothetical protein